MRSKLKEYLKKKYFPEIVEMEENIRILNANIRTICQNPTSIESKILIDYYNTRTNMEKLLWMGTYKDSTSVMEGGFEGFWDNLTGQDV